MSPVYFKGVQLLDTIIHYFWPRETWVYWWTIGHSSSSTQILRLSRASLGTTENPAASDALREDLINSSPDRKVAEGGKEDEQSREGFLFLPPLSYFISIPPPPSHFPPFWVSMPSLLCSLFAPHPSVSANEWNALEVNRGKRAWLFDDGLQTLTHNGRIFTGVETEGQKK